MTFFNLLGDFKELNTSLKQITLSFSILSKLSTIKKASIK